MEIIFLPMQILIAVPFGGFIPAMLFFYIYKKRRPHLSKKRNWILLGVTIGWLVYANYETYMYFWMKTVVAPIRMDLLILTPILYIGSLAGLLAAFLRSPQKDPSN